MNIPRNAVRNCVDGIMKNGARTATVFAGPNLIIRATRRFRPNARERTIDIYLTIGQPNYREREFIRACKKAGEPIPVRKVQFKFYAAKNAKRRPQRKS
jgi:hypothetical protein